MLLSPTIGPEQILGIFRWLKTFVPETGPRAAICLMTPLEPSATNPSMRLYKTVWNDCPPELRKRIALFCRTPQISEMFAKYAGMPTQVFPLVIPQDLAVPSPSPTGAPGDPMMVSFVGGPRRERSIELVPDVVKRHSETGVQFFIQARRGEDTTFDIGRLTALSGLPHVQVHEGALERKDYYRVIANSVSLT